MRRRAHLRLLVVPAVLLLLAVGCQPVGQLASRGSDDWSRGARLGQTVLNGHVGLSARPAAGGYHAAWVAEDEEGSQRLRLARVSDAGEIERVGDLPLSVTRPEQVMLLGGVQDESALLWVDRLGDDSALLHAAVDGEGALVRPPQRISAEGEHATSYAVVGDGQGGAYIVWAVEEGGGAGLRAAHLLPDGSVRGTRHLGLAGFEPAVGLDDGGAVHLAWLTEPGFGQREIRYATYDPQAATVSHDIVLASLPVPTGLVLRAPTVGLAGEWVYVFWSLERRGGGPTPPSAESFVATFRRGAPEAAGRPRQVVVPPVWEPRYVSVESALPLRELALVPQQALAADFVYFAAAADAVGDELPVAFSVQLAGRTKVANQIVLTLWRDGRMSGYQVVTRSEGVSLRPRLLSIDSGGLALAWIDTAGFRRYDVHLAGTPGAMRAHLNRTRLQDVVAAVGEGVWGFVQALGFAPIVITWLVPALVLLSIYVLVQPEGDLRRTWPQIALVVAGLLYVGFKYIFRPSWLLEFPVPKGVSPALSEGLTLAAPILIALVAAGVVLLYVKRREYPSLFPAFLIFAGSDALLTLLIYVPAVLSE